MPIVRLGEGRLRAVSSRLARRRPHKFFNESTRSVAKKIDPITVSVLQHRLTAIVEEMGEAMLRTAYSQILNSSRDFSTAICDPDGRLIA